MRGGRASYAGRAGVSDPGPFTTECVWCHAPIRHRVDTSVTPPYEWWEAHADYTTRATCQAIGEPDHLVMGGHQSVKDEWWLEDQESGDRENSGDAGTHHNHNEQEQR